MAILGRMDLHDKTEVREERRSSESIVVLDTLYVDEESFKLCFLAV